MNRPIRRTLLAAACLASTTAFGQVRFLPQIFVETGYVDDVSYGTSQTPGVDLSDRVSRVTVRLPVERVTRTGSLLFAFEPGYEKYADFDQLDQFLHRTRLEGERVGSRTVGRFEVRYEQSQGQLDPGGGDAPELFVSPRADRDYFEATGSLERELGNRWLGRGGLEVRDYTFEPVDLPGFPAPSTLQTSDRTEYDVALGAARRAKRGGSIGFEIRTTRFDFDDGNEDEVDSFAAVWDRTVGRRDRVVARLGAFQAESRATSGMTVDDDGLLLGLEWERTTRNATLSIDLSRRPRAATSQNTETATTSRLIFEIATRDAARWDSGASLDLVRREADAGDLERVETSGYVERRFGDRHGLRLNALHTEQTNDALPEFDAEYYTANLAWVWYPRGIAR